MLRRHRWQALALAGATAAFVLTAIALDGRVSTSTRTGTALAQARRGGDPAIEGRPPGSAQPLPSAPSAQSGPSGPSASAPSASGETARRQAATATCDVAVSTWPVSRLAGAVITAPVQLSTLAGAHDLVTAGIGGLLLVGPSPAPDLVARLAQLRAAAPDGWRLLVASDEEGGGIQRLAAMTTRMPWARDMSATGPDAVRAQGHALGIELARLGVTVDFAPVGDLDAGPGPDGKHPDGQRSFSVDPSVTGPDVAAFVSGLQSAGIGAVVKHFPGLGTATANTDMQAASIDPWARIRTRDLGPFRDAIAAHVRAVMTSHASVPGLSDGPASLSPDVTAVLRHDLGFDGAIVTDSLSAVAIERRGLDVPAAAVRALAAGADDVVFGGGDTVNGYRTAVLVQHAIIAAVRDGRLNADQLRDSARRDAALTGAVTC